MATTPSDPANPEVTLIPVTEGWVRWRESLLIAEENAYFEAVLAEAGENAPPWLGELVEKRRAVARAVDLRSRIAHIRGLISVAESRAIRAEAMGDDTCVTDERDAILRNTAQLSDLERELADLERAGLKGTSSGDAA